MVVSRTEYESLLRLQEKGKQPAAQLATEGSNPCSLSHSASWLIDYGASHHMTGNSTLLSPFTSCAPTKMVTLANGTRCPISGTGTVTAISNLSLSSVLCVPTFSCNLLSVSQLTNRLNCSVTFFPSNFVFQDLTTGKKIGLGHATDGLYYLDDAITPTAFIIFIVSPVSMENTIVFSTRFVRMTWLYIIKDRSEVFSTFCLLYAEITNQYSRSLKCLRIDNAREYFSDRHGFQEFLSSRGIIHQSSCAHTSQQNGVAERKIWISPQDLINWPQGQSSVFSWVIHEPRRVNDATVLSFAANLSVLMSPFFEDTPYFPASSSLPVSPSPLPLPVPVPSLPPDPVQRPFQVYTRKRFTTSVEPSCPAISSQQAGPLPSSFDDAAQVDESLDAPIVSRIRSRTTHHPIYDAQNGGVYSSAREDMLDSRWGATMEAEMDALAKNQTWQLASLPPGAQVVGCKWVFTIKYLPDGSVERLKAQFALPLCK
ncbi:uncharacterized protein LOC143885920 [Tasmannia lanceolata]|uniref:uncharacterized protein LOC143885920 n=1 Tax=Tasmannia lanceolata TaxID=3420 RepID=UPI004064AE07